MIELAKTVEQISKVSDFSDLTENKVNEISEIIESIEYFNSKIESYGKHIFESIFKKCIADWKEFLSPKDFNSFWSDDEANDFHYKYKEYVYCYKSKTMYDYRGCEHVGSGDLSQITESFRFEKGNLIITNTFNTKNFRRDSKPWTKRERRIIIDYKNKQVSLKGDSIHIR